ncbi:MAG: hypothetical protein WCS40_05180, partial [Methanomethylophilus sp.]
DRSKIKVLFVDSANDLPSQIAEHFANQLYGDRCQAFSAGPTKDIVDCDLLSVMYCAGEDLRQQFSKDFDDASLPPEYDYVVYLQKAVYDRWAPQEPLWKDKQILAEMGSRKEFKCSDDVELENCIQDMASRIKAWLAANLKDPAKLQALVTA